MQVAISIGNVLRQAVKRTAKPAKIVVAVQMADAWCGLLDGFQVIEAAVVGSQKEMRKIDFGLVELEKKSSSDPLQKRESRKRKRRKGIQKGKKD